ncbi:HNH endonuclease family protein [Streptomyces longispororuber]|uniref:HNH endonuclease family protein n=1 Tax=Streptomyces longispororuber TaxID=68230 RepID=UPI00210A1F63|nr:HNH endonuclease family protein [Streptomyces longispororuber]MCQ4206813.1 HNH endonuclease family protein [Streptomyces longispororuber]
MRRSLRCGAVGALLVVGAAAACTPPQLDRAEHRTSPTATPRTLASKGFPPDAARARTQLAGLTVAWGKNWETYERSEFGDGWSDDVDAPGGRNGCDTRDDVLRRDLTDLREGDRNPCVVLSGTLHDPYTGKDLPYSYRRASQIQTDHVVALGAAWRAGAWAWTPKERLTYANDLDVLLATDKTTNYEKSSKTPDKWKPPNHGYWCAYGRRWTGIKHKYRLTVTAPEKLALQDLLATCPAEIR